MRKEKLPGSLPNPLYREVAERIHSITIANKKIVNSGLELADLAGYCLYRKLSGDPQKKLKVDINLVLRFLEPIKKKAFEKIGTNPIIEVT